VQTLRVRRSAPKACSERTLPLRTEEIASVAEEAEVLEEEQDAPPVESEWAEELVGRSGVRHRYVEDNAGIHKVVGERPMLKLQTLVAFGAQIAPYPDGKPAGPTSSSQQSLDGEEPGLRCRSILYQRGSTYLLRAPVPRASSTGQSRTLRSFSTSGSTPTRQRPRICL
jgi:hypothetical protein